MKTQITPSLSLTTDHPASSYGVPVLVHGQYPDQVFGPSDLIQCYNQPPQPAALLVHRYAKLVRNPEGLKMVDRFLAAWPDGPQLRVVVERKAGWTDKEATQ